MTEALYYVEYSNYYTVEVMLVCNILGSKDNHMKSLQILAADFDFTLR